MNLHLLRLFTAVVEHGSVGAAARSLGVSQPAVSRAVRELETQTGLALLERSARGIRLTAEGEEVYAHARGVYAAERAVEESIASMKGMQKGTLHIGASTTIATYVLPEILSRFSDQHPGIELMLSAVHTRMLVQMLRRYELDVVLAEAPVHDERIRVMPWRMDEMIAIVPPHHRLTTHRGPVPPSALSDELIVLREPESGTRTIVLKALAHAGVEVRRSISVDSTEVIKQLVAGGFGIGVVSRVAVQEQLSLGRVVELKVKGLHVTRPFNRLALRGRRPSSATRAFLSVLGDS